MKLGLIWPNPGNDAVRYALIALDTIVTAPGMLTIAYDIRLRASSGDIPNLIRQLIVFVAIAHVRVKLLLSILQSKLMKEVLDIIDEDYAKFNQLPQEYHALILDNIEKTKRYQNSWFIMIGLTLLSYVLLAIVFTTYSQLFSDDPRKYMIHECRLLFLEEGGQYVTPVYELFQVYSLCVLWGVFIGFVGYDGIFIVSIMHISLRLKIISLNLSHISRDINDIVSIKETIKQFVKDHCEVQGLISKIETCFQWWLIMLFFNAILQTVMSLSQTVKNDGDYTYMFYLLFFAVILHTYLLCFLISYVTYTGEDIADVAYNIPWALIPDEGVKKSIAMIITRAQKPYYFKAMGMLTFNMQLFTKILQTSYSIFTILRK